MLRDQDQSSHQLDQGPRKVRDLFEALSYHHFNLESAGLALGLILEGCLDFTTERIVDLSYRRGASRVGATIEEVRDSLGTNPHINRLTSVLYAALAVSPLLLLVRDNSALVAGTYTKGLGVYKHWHQGGNKYQLNADHPLMRVENILWGLLVRMALGEITATQLLERFWNDEVVKQVWETETNPVYLDAWDMQIAWKDDDKRETHTMDGGADDGMDAGGVGGGGGGIKGEEELLLVGIPPVELREMDVNAEGEGGSGKDAAAEEGMDVDKADKAGDRGQGGSGEGANVADGMDVDEADKVGSTGEGTSTDKAAGDAVTGAGMAEADGNADGGGGGAADVTAQEFSNRCSSIDGWRKAPPTRVCRRMQRWVQWGRGGGRWGGGRGAAADMGTPKNAVTGTVALMDGGKEVGGGGEGVGNAGTPKNSATDAVSLTDGGKETGSGGEGAGSSNVGGESVVATGGGVASASGRGESTADAAVQKNAAMEAVGGGAGSDEKKKGKEGSEARRCSVDRADTLDEGKGGGQGWKGGTEEIGDWFKVTEFFNGWLDLKTTKTLIQELIEFSMGYLLPINLTTEPFGIYLAPSLVEGLRELPEGFPCLVPTPIVNLLEANSPLSLERDQTRSHDTSGLGFDQPHSQLNALLVACYASLQRFKGLMLSSGIKLASSSLTLVYSYPCVMIHALSSRGGGRKGGKKGEKVKGEGDGVGEWDGGVDFFSGWLMSGNRLEVEKSVELVNATQVRGYQLGPRVEESQEHDFPWKMAVGSTVDVEALLEMLNTEIKGVDRCPLICAESAWNTNPDLKPEKEQSCVLVSMPADFVALPARTQQRILQNRCILLVDAMDGPDPGFNLDSLSLLRDPYTLCDYRVWALSIISDPSYRTDMWEKDIGHVGRLEQLLNTEAHGGWASFNTLQNPQENATIPMLPAFHWRGTHTVGDCGNEGGKVVMSYGRNRNVPREDLEEGVLAGNFASWHAFNVWEPRGAMEEFLRWEFFVLRPGVALDSYMPSIQIHWVLSLSECIAWGHHFHCVSTMGRSVQSTLHDAITNSVTMNTSHATARWLMIWIFIFEVEHILKHRTILHIPDVRNKEELWDVVCLLSFVVLYPALDAVSYKGVLEVVKGAAPAHRMDIDRFAELTVALGCADKPCK
ncbi:hypothetical protein B0H11DRAFT_1937916 [Mycena galericulata]|nr:hypothetical protein B0H11DRAFT_1937916 [Mycena galericulata]